MELTCPKCRASMRTYERGGVTVDQCTECRGIFLDRGELERLIDAESSHYGRPDDGRGDRDDRYRAAAPPRDDRYREEKYRDDSRYKDDHRHKDDYRYKDGYRGDDPRRRKKKSFLEELFD